MRFNLRILNILVALGLAVPGFLQAQNGIFTITSGTPPNTAVQSPYPAFTFTANDPLCSSTTYSFASPDLPTFLSLTPAGVLSAVGNGATSPGAYTFHVTATDTCPSRSVTSTYTIQVGSTPETYFL